MQQDDMTSEAIIATILDAAPRNRLIRHPIFRQIYLVIYLLYTFIILIPAWSLLYMRKGNRPRTSWTLERCLRVRFSRQLCGLVARCEIDYLGRNLNIELDTAKLTQSHPTTLPPAPHKLLRGYPARALQQLHERDWNTHLLYQRDARWARREKIYGFAPVEAFWFDGKKTSPDAQRRRRKAGEAVMLHFHGGGYLCGTAAETDLTSSIPKALVVHSPIHHILSVDYRLAPDAPWPLPLLDAISSYNYLRQEGISEKDIVLVGDSAGGHLALALARWIRDEGKAIGWSGPRGLVLLSPWVDVGFSNFWGEGAQYNAESDTIDDTFGPFATSLLLRALPAEEMHTSSYVSPASHLLPANPSSFRDFPPSYVVYGGAERIVKSIKLFWKRLQMARERDSPDRLVEGKDSPHDFMIFPWMADETAKVYEDLDVWLRNLLASDYEETAPSPEIAASPTWLRRRDSRKVVRDSLKATRSPTLTARKSGMLVTLDDFRAESMGMVDVPPLDLDAEWVEPFTPHRDDDTQDSWFEVG